MVVIVVTMIIIMVRPWACPDIGHVCTGFMQRWPSMYGTEYTSLPVVEGRYGG